MSRRDELAKGIQQTVQPVEQGQVYPVKKPDIPAKTMVAIKSTPHFTVTALGIQAATGGTEDEYEALGKGLIATVRALPWIWGDYMVIGSDMQWGAYKRVAEQLDMNWRTLQEYAYVCRNVHLSLRNDRLSFSHHRAVADLYDEDHPAETMEVQRAALAYAVDHRLTVDAFRETLHSTAIEAVTQLEGDDGIVSLAPLPPAPFYEKPINQFKKSFLKRWKTATDDARQAALKELKALVRELERME